MLAYTFAHVPGVGPATERRLRAASVRTWDDALAWSGPPPIGQAKWERVVACSRESRERLDARDWAFLGAALPHREHWRAWPELRGDEVYLDIETTGLGDWAEVSVVGLWEPPGEPQAFVRGRDLDGFRGPLASHALLVTFFGSAFDVPFLLQRYPGLRLPPLHIDLCFLLRRLGVRGGLKAIERSLGIRRSAETEGLSGDDAVRLWHQHLRGDPCALDTLLAYNREDLASLGPLLDHAVGLMAEREGGAGAGPRSGVGRV